MRRNSLRDVAQLVARLLWEQDVAGSNPVIPTKNGRCPVMGHLTFFFENARMLKPKNPTYYMEA